MTPRKTLLLIAAFVFVTFGSFVLYIIREVTAQAATLPLSLVGGIA